MSTDELTILRRLGAEYTIRADERVRDLRDQIKRNGLTSFTIRLGTIGADTVIFLDWHGKCRMHRKFNATGVSEIAMYLAGYGDAKDEWRFENEEANEAGE